MATTFPKKLQLLIDDGIRHLWDPKYPDPDLSLLAEWLESEAWDEVVNGMMGGYIDRDRVLEFLDDETLMEDFEIDELTGISDQDRIDFARGRIHDLFEDNMCSVHVIDVESKAMPPASLAMTMYYHPQGGAEFYDLTICHSAEDYLASLKPECILEQSDLPDEEILKLWKKPKARRKAKLKMA
jgi:hypothetical protein